MSDDQRQFLTGLGRPQFRLNAEQVAWALNCHQNDVRVLVAAKLLKPLGNPPHNGQKFFATSDILQLAENRAWLVKATNCLYKYWHDKNRDRSKSASRPNLRAIA